MIMIMTLEGLLAASSAEEWYVQELRVPGSPYLNNELWIRSILYINFFSLVGKLHTM